MRGIVRSVVASMALTLVPATALAQEADGEKKPLEDVEAPSTLENAAADVKAEAAEDPAGKAGPILLEAGVGPSFNLTSEDLALALQDNLGFALVKGDGGTGFGDGDLYLVLTPSLSVGELLGIILPVGVQYDIPMPIEGVYLYPRATVGYAAILNPGDGDSGDALAVTPTAGVKLQASPAFHVALEPVSLPIYLGNGSSVLEYRALALAGFDL